MNYTQEQIDEIEENTRKCDICNKPMKEGFCIGGGDAYYCSKRCLHKEITEAEFLELYDDGNGDSYYTEWETIYNNDSTDGLDCD